MLADLGPNLSLVEHTTQRTELLRLRAGDRRILERVYLQHVERIEALIRAGLRRAGRLSPANVADLVQEVFAKAFSPKVLAAYDGEREYGPFLRQIGRNVVIDWLRRSNRELWCDLDLDCLTDEGHLTSAPDTGPFSADLLATAERFVLGLGPELRAVHERRFLAGESQEQAAQRLGISRQTLRTRERRLLDGLRHELRLAEFAERANHARRNGLPISARLNRGFRGSRYRTRMRRR